MSCIPPYSSVYSLTDMPVSFSHCTYKHQLTAVSIPACVTVSAQLHCCELAEPSYVVLIRVKIVRALAVCSLALTANMSAAPVCVCAVQQFTRRHWEQSERTLRSHELDNKVMRSINDKRETIDNHRLFVCVCVCERVSVCGEWQRVGSNHMQQCQRHAVNRLVFAIKLQLSVRTVTLRGTHNP